MKTKVLSLALIAAFAVACQKDKEVQDIASPQVISDIKDLKIPSNFDFSTAREVQASITVKGSKDQPLGGKRVSFYKGDPDQGAALLGVGVTNPAGMLDMPLQVPAYTEEVTVLVHANGFANKQVVSSLSDIKIDFGGKPAERNFGFSTPTSIMWEKKPELIRLSSL